MKEHPIIFSTEMVKAILDGRKTQTRRVIKPQPQSCRHKEIFSPSEKGYNSLPDWRGQIIDWIGYKYEGRTGWFCYVCGNGLKHIDEWSAHGIICPYQVGDSLWVRESWRIESFMDGEPLLFGYKDGKTKEENEYSDTANYEEWYERICIQSTDDAEKAFKQGLIQQNEEGIYLWDIGKSPYRWRPSIHMPRWASRLTQAITGIRAERLQDITEEDARAEGVESFKVGLMPTQVLTYATDWPNPICGDTAVNAFRNLWDSINAKRGYPWSSNPWVWVIDFEVVK